MPITFGMQFGTCSPNVHVLNFLESIPKVGLGLHIFLVFIGFCFVFVFVFSFLREQSFDL